MIPHQRRCDNQSTAIPRDIFRARGRINLRYSKIFFGTGWRNAQLITTLSSGNVLLPEDWNYKDNDITIRAKIMGEPVYRRLSYRKSDDPSLTTMAYLQFDNNLHVTTRWKKGQLENEPIEEKVDSYYLLKL